MCDSLREHLFGCTLAAGNRAVHGGIVSRALRCFSGEEQRSIDGRCQVTPSRASTDYCIAVRPAGKRIGLPVVREAVSQFTA